MIYDLVVVGGGAAGFFGAIETATRKPGYRIVILEKTTRLLAKVKVSGGGRCNVTHHSFSPAALSQHYPRGQKAAKKWFHNFQAEDTVAWFAQRGIALKTEDDGRMFPESDDSQTIIDCFLTEAERLRIQIKTSVEVTALQQEDNLYLLTTTGGIYRTKKILVAMGGHAKSSAYDWLRTAGHIIDPPIPSLFTFNDSEKDFTNLMGVAVPSAEVKIATTRFSQRGALLITHWGLSGPAVIKLSAWAAEHLFRCNYVFTAIVNWTGLPEKELRKVIDEVRSAHPRQSVMANTLFGLPKRLWELLCERADIPVGKAWGELGQKTINRLVEGLFASSFAIRGKTTFKEEFVTCGGVSLTEVETYTLESKKLPGVFFAGEVLNVDGETGGFNFQAAWTTAWLAARSITA